MSDADNSTQKVINPLWLISLFLGLTEVTVGAAATQVGGGVQILFACFSVAFPAAVAAAFFAVLWTKPYVLYAPKDFPRHLNARAYAQAMQSVSVVSTTAALRYPGNVPAGQQAYAQWNLFVTLRDATWSQRCRRSALITKCGCRIRQTVTEKAIGLAVEAAMTKIAGAGRTGVDVAADVDAAVAAVRREYQKTLVSVNLDQFPGKVSRMSLPISDEMKMVDFLDQVWINMADQVPPFTYGSTWVLQDMSTGQVLFGEFLLDSRLQERTYTRDIRTIRDVGIHGGMSLLGCNLRRRPLHGLTSADTTIAPAGNSSGTANSRVSP